jgi:signal transduction histidine kinase
VLAATRDSITLAGADGAIVLRNPAAEAALHVYGIDGATIRETTSALAHRIVRPEPYKAWVETALTDPEYAGEYEFELADSNRSFQSVTTPVRDDAGAILGRLFVVRETTAEREVDRLRTDLVATVSHELRTPLTSILGFAELLLARDPDVPTQARYLETIYREGRRLTDLVNHFLDLQRIENNAFELELEPVDLGDLVRDTSLVFEGQSAKHDLELSVDDGADLCAPADRERIRQVLGNLLSNAIKYSPAGGEVAVEVCRRNGSVRVSVSDAGVGIPSDQQEHVFEKFFRVDSSATRSIGGTGLGLALCREIVTLHGGRIGFDSAAGHGSTFWFELPAGASE